jgi:hypothetical protein
MHNLWEPNHIDFSRGTSPLKPWHPLYGTPAHVCKFSDRDHGADEISELDCENSAGYGWIHSICR